MSGLQSVVHALVRRNVWIEMTARNHSETQNHVGPHEQSILVTRLSACVQEPAVVIFVARPLHSWLNKVTRVPVESRQPDLKNQRIGILSKELIYHDPDLVWKVK